MTARPPTPTPPEKALLELQHIFWILGGKAKAGGIEPLRPLFGRVAKAYLIGEAAPDFAATLEGQLSPYEQCGTLDVAVAAAARDAAESGAEEPVVLLSPACASYDQYANFEKRGDAFREQVQAFAAKAHRTPVRFQVRSRSFARMRRRRGERRVEAIRQRRRSMVSRAERSLVADWWWTVDRWLLRRASALIVLGLVLIMAGSPPVADRLHLPPFHFVNRQVEFLIPRSR